MSRPNDQKVEVDYSLVRQMRKWKKKSTYEYFHLPTTLLVASFGGACAFYTIENTIDDILESWGHHANKPLEWQVNMGALCVGTLTFVVFLFILQVLETRSKLTAWRSSASWVPLIGLTAVDTVVLTSRSTSWPWPAPAMASGPTAEQAACVAWSVCHDH